MIRGPVLPEAREALWALVATRLEVIERGLTLCCEAVDCSEGRFGTVEGLLRDAQGGAVLLVVASDTDVHLAPRVLAAAQFLARVGDALATAAPEAALCPGRPGRVLVVGGSHAAAGLELVRRLMVPGVEVCCLEGFRVGGAERLAVRWLGRPSTEPMPARVHQVEFEVPASCRDQWRALEALCERLDPAVRVDGGRFQRRITWNGRELGEVVARDGALFATDGVGVRHCLSTPREVRGFGDALLRGYLRAAGIQQSGAAAGTRPRSVRGDVATVTTAPMARAGESLRETLAASRLSPEEYSLLGAPTCAAAPEHEASNAEEYVARMVGEPDGSWTLPRPSE